jgi:hypothetical protein
MFPLARRLRQTSALGHKRTSTCVRATSASPAFAVLLECPESAKSRPSLSIVARGRNDFRPRSFGNIGFIGKAPIGQFIVAHSEVMPDGGRHI